MDTPNKQRQNGYSKQTSNVDSLSRLGTDTSVKSGSVKLVLWTQTSPLGEIQTSPLGEIQTSPFGELFTLEFN
jgi:hypothetical protein